MCACVRACVYVFIFFFYLSRIYRDVYTVIKTFVISVYCIKIKRNGRWYLVPGLLPIPLQGFLLMNPRFDKHMSFRQASLVVFPFFFPPSQDLPIDDCRRPKSFCRGGGARGGGAGRAGAGAPGGPGAV